MNGIEMMLKSAGIDLPKITSDFETLKTGVLQTLKKIDDRLAVIEGKVNDLWQAQQPYHQTPEQSTPAQPPAAQPPAKLLLIPQQQQPQVPPTMPPPPLVQPNK